MEIDRIKRNIKKMIDQGAEESEINEYLSVEGVTIDQLKGAQKETPKSFMENIPGETRSTISNIARPVLEGVGMGVGATVGAGGGSAAGPLGALGGGVAGAALGKGIGGNIADRLDEFLKIAVPMTTSKSFQRATHDVITGAQEQMAGEVIFGPAAKGARLGLKKLADKLKLTDFFSMLKNQYKSLSDEGLILKSKQILSEMRQEGTTGKFAERARRVGELTDEMGVKTPLTYSQKTGSTRAALEEQAMAARHPELAGELKSREDQIVTEAKGYVEKQFPGAETIEDARLAVGKEKSAFESARATGKDQLEAAKSQAMQATGEDVAKIKAGKEPYETGMSLYEITQAAKGIESKRVGALFDKIPQDVKVSTKPIVEAVKSVMKDAQEFGGGPDTMPERMLTQISKKLFQKTKQGTKVIEEVTFGNLRDWRMQIGRLKRSNAYKQDPNGPLAVRLNMLQKGVDDTIEQLSGKGGNIPKLYETARSEYLKYIQTFKQGSVGDVLHLGRQVGGLKTKFEDMPAKFFRSDNLTDAMQLKTAVGEKEAKGLIDEFVSHSLRSKVKPTGEFDTASGMKWLRNNESVLKEYGLWDKYKNIVLRAKSSDEAGAMLKEFEKVTAKSMAEFEKTSASVILNSDVDKVIEAVFSKAGKKTTAKAATDLLNTPGIKDNEAAVNGVKNAFKDFYMKSIEKRDITDIVRAADKFMDTYKPAMKVLYEKEPKKLQSLEKYHELLSFLITNKNVSYTKGPTTAEKLMMGKESRITDIIGKAAQFIAVQQQKGWKWSASKNLFTAFFSAPKKYKAEQIEKYLVKAIADPDFAETIMNAAIAPKSKAVMKKIEYNLKSLIPYMAEKSFEGED